MKLSQSEREMIISVLEKEWKYMFQAGFAIPLVSRLQEAIDNRSDSFYRGLLNTPEIRLGIEREFSDILENWCGETAKKYLHLSHELLDKNLFWLKVVTTEDHNALGIALSPTILELYNGVSPINVFNWVNWSDSSLKNAYDDLTKKGIEI